MSGKRRQASGTGKKKRGDRYSRNNRFGMFCLLLQTILSLVFMGVVVLLNMLPARYLVLIGLLLFFLWTVTLNTQVSRRTRRTIGKGFSVIVMIFLLTGTYYLARTNDMISQIASGAFKVDKMVVAVLADDPAEALEDAADYNFGVQFAMGAENVQAAVLDIEEELGTDSIEMTECSSIQDQAEKLHDGEVDAIIYNQAYTENLEEAFDNYSDSVKIIYSHDIRVELDFGTSTNITKEPFTVYISGIDVYGEIEQSSRSDVNIIAVVNPTTYQILLVTTPRDYYVEIPGISEGMNDKLTHAGIYGVDASMATLGQLYETDIKYYVRINFTSMIDIVDALGGVDVYSEYEFTTSKNSGVVMDVSQGYNHFDGEQALAFSRERKNLEDGDNQRGKNQQAVITAMLKKVLSPTMLLQATSIMKEVSEGVETNISQSQINSLIKYQLSKNADWSIQSVAATGTASREYCYSATDPLYVTIPDYDNVNEIIDLVNVVEEGGTLTDAEKVN
ncbi:MAG TPA: LCP family protein [Candidatus Mediterraneibacter intestinavium]|nr:LCP family protein [Candidatus Mediterraneibacter intestinavium]